MMFELVLDSKENIFGVIGKDKLLYWSSESISQLFHKTNIDIFPDHTLKDVASMECLNMYGESILNMGLISHFHFMHLLRQSSAPNSHKLYEDFYKENFYIRVPQTFKMVSFLYQCDNKSTDESAKNFFDWVKLKCYDKQLEMSNVSSTDGAKMKVKMTNPNLKNSLLNIRFSSDDPIQMDHSINSPLPLENEANYFLHFAERMINYTTERSFEYSTFDACRDRFFLNNSKTSIPMQNKPLDLSKQLNFLIQQEPMDLSTCKTLNV